ncbi:MAG: hypothetical protein WCK39_09140 [Methanomassiliicoccales archaeon]
MKIRALLARYAFLVGALALALVLSGVMAFSSQATGRAGKVLPLSCKARTAIAPVASLSFFAREAKAAWMPTVPAAAFCSIKAARL